MQEPEFKKEGHTQGGGHLTKSIVELNTTEICEDTSLQTKLDCQSQHENTGMFCVYCML